MPQTHTPATPAAPPVGLATIAGLVGAVVPLVAALAAFVGGVETIEQAVVASVALVAGAAVLIAVVLGRMAQTRTLNEVRTRAALEQGRPDLVTGVDFSQRAGGYQRP